MKYHKPPVKYVVAKLKFSKVFGKYAEDKYKDVLNKLDTIGLERIVVSKVNQLELHQSGENFKFSEGTVDRVGFFSANSKRCAIISEQVLEFRLSEYDDHKHFLDDAYSFYEKFIESGFAVENPISEIELHYVDHFIPVECELADMFQGVTLPIGQFYSKDNDFFQFGGLNFSRILDSKREKIQVSLEQLPIGATGESEQRNLPKLLPDTLIEPDSKLGMPISVEYPESSVGKHYALVHTQGSKLITPEDNKTVIRDHLEELYKEGRLTFDKMINTEVCNGIWELME
ncbi:hypothetical protein CWC25_02150 [Pseudoalteromonas sp. S4389]|uniref:TIGR04255 family protein n=1 Tax=Pseudoalteromonas sp. S4389 TaxID=579556 RepID=UPI001108A9FA|nr:TIGR04255 family protein [Pseudoalteromonas sp. S4389]TMO47074.1 hypothetical protein CWC25_02150 [Pseudoalteromonas sp. S4389]